MGFETAHMTSMFEHASLCVAQLLQEAYAALEAITVLQHQKRATAMLAAMQARWVEGVGVRGSGLGVRR